MKIISVVGARPNFMKIAPFVEAIKAHNVSSNAKIEHILVHTGQHYDIRMADAFFKALRLPEPDINLQIGSGTHAEQVGNTMIAFEKILLEYKPDWVVVPGDVNATIACALAAKKLNIRVCHIEAGLRSNDETMPEEINRIVTDRIADLLLTPDRFANENLLREGRTGKAVVFVGNIMIDTLLAHFDTAAQRDIAEIVESNTIGETKFDSDNYALVTLHRPSNVDDLEALSRIVHYLSSNLTNEIKVVWVVHPRTRKQLEQAGLWNQLLETKKLCLIHPLDYHDMLRLNIGSSLVLTDSGGLQEECTVLGKPCIILRPNTERPTTLVENGGAGVLTGNAIEKIEKAQKYFKANNVKVYHPELWDGNAASRCLEAILKFN
jgi:UDP-N-acetylglucosamine 2-epimerase (non-hydrolysing)